MNHPYVKLIYTFIWMLLMSVFLTSCFNQYTPPEHYQLTTFNQKQFVSAPVKATLLVSQIVPSQAYQSNDMIYVNQHYQVSAFIENNWDVPPSEMLFPLLVQSLQNTGYFHAVIPAPSFAYTDWRLDTHLIKLQQDFTRKPSVVEFQMTATLINDEQSSIVANKLFSVEVPAPMETPYGGVLAANKACQQVMEEMSAWVVQNAKGK